MTFADAMIRFAEDRLLTGEELRALFRGIGIEASEQFEPDQIVEAMDISCIPLAAARLAAKADGNRSGTDYAMDALNLMELVKDHHLLPHSQGLPLPIEIRKAAVGLGIIADAAAALIRNRMMPPLTPIVNTPEQIAEFEQFIAEEMSRVKAAHDLIQSHTDSPADASENDHKADDGVGGVAGDEDGHAAEPDR